MQYAIDDILRDVRITLDENKTNEQLITEEDIDTLMLDEIIRSKILDAVRAVVQNAPVYMLGTGESFASGAVTLKGDVAVMSLPSDFLRLISFQMDDWAVPVTTPIFVDDDEYALQSSKFSGARGNTLRPVVAFVMQEGGLILEGYTTSTDKVKLALYVRIPTATDDKVDFGEKLYTAVVYYTAHLTMLSVQNYDFAQQLLAKAQEFIA